MSSTQQIKEDQFDGMTGGAIWGGITGIIDNQSDLAAKFTTLQGMIPVNNNQLTNGAGYITAGSSNTLTNKSGSISQWTNDSGYITDLSGVVPKTRVITTTSPIRIDAGDSADLSVNRTLSWDFSIPNTWGGVQSGTFSGFHIGALQSTATSPIASLTPFMGGFVFRINNVANAVIIDGNGIISFNTGGNVAGIRITNVTTVQRNALTPLVGQLAFDTDLQKLFIKNSTAWELYNAVTSVTNSDGTLTISPTTGTVVASLALGHTNTWTGIQSFNGIGSSTGMQFTSPGGAGTGLNGIAFNFGTYTGVSSFPRAYEIQGAYTAASGTGIFSALRFAHTLNQSGGSGAVWGIWYNPTVTAALDHVAINLSSGRSVFNELSLGTDMTNTVPTWLNIAAGTTSKSQMRFTGGVAPTSPVNGDFWFDSSNVFNFNGAEGIIQNNTGASQPAGLSFINNTASTVSVNQQPGYISMTGTAWKTNATAGSQPWVVNLVANALTGTANPLPQFVIGASANGVGLLNWLTLTSTAATIQSLGTIVLSNNGGVHLNCSGNRTIMQNAQVWVNNKLAAGNGGAFDPTAKVHIGGGTATAATAPLKFTAGTNMSTAEVGAMEYDGGNLFFTRTGTTRENVLMTPLVSSVSPTVQNRTIKVTINSTDYYITAKTTND